MSGKSNSNAFGFLLIAAVAACSVQFAPGRPEPWFIAFVLAQNAITGVMLFLVKRGEPKPINWLTADVLFAGTFSIIHFSYFPYWLMGVFDGQQVIWHYRHAHVPHTVCTGLAMYSCTLNLFLFGYHFLTTQRYRPVITEVTAPSGLKESWGRLGRILMRIGFLGFAGYVAILGPSVVFGTYTGTNNKGFLPNISYQLGQTFLMAGITTAFVAKQRMFASQKNAIGIGWIDGFLIITTLFAIGLHGQRSTLIMVFVPVLIGRSEYVKPFTLRTLCISGLVVVALMGLIVGFRSARDSKYDFNPLRNMNKALLNLGSSAVCGFVAIDYVPRKHDYYRGRMQVLHLMGAVPFSRKLSGFPDSIDTSSSMLLTKLIQGSAKAGVAGTGTSAFADLYFDFGFAGTSVVFFATGLFMKWLQNQARLSTSLLWQVGFILCVAHLALCSRFMLLGGFFRYGLHGAIYTAVIAYAIGIPVSFYAKQRLVVRPFAKA